MAELQRDHARLARRLARVEAIIEVPKKWRSCWGCRWRPTTTGIDHSARQLPAGPRHGERSLRRIHARRAAPPVIRRPRAKPARALTSPQQHAVLNLLQSPRSADQAPAEIYTSLLDEDLYLCSIRTMYRILGQHSEIRERRAQLRHPVYQKPELLAFLGKLRSTHGRSSSYPIVAGKIDQT